MKAYYFFAVPMYDGLPKIPVICKMCDGKRMALNVALGLKAKYGESFAVTEYIATVNK